MYEELCSLCVSVDEHDFAGVHLPSPHGQQVMTTSTPDRLLDAAALLFAERGFAGTSVADIEEAAGFTRRGGTLFKHFPSKQAVFAAMIDRHADAVGDALDLTSLLPLGDLRSELTLVARFILAELTEEESIHRALNCGGAEVPDARERMLADVLEPGYRRSAELLQRWIGDTYRIPDPEATVIARDAPIGDEDGRRDGGVGGG